MRSQSNVSWFIWMSYNHVISDICQLHPFPCKVIICFFSLFKNLFFLLLTYFVSYATQLNETYVHRKYSQKSLTSYNIIYLANIQRRRKKRESKKINFMIKFNCTLMHIINSYMEILSGQFSISTMGKNVFNIFLKLEKKAHILSKYKEIIFLEHVLWHHH